LGIALERFAVIALALGLTGLIAAHGCAIWPLVFFSCAACGAA